MEDATLQIVSNTSLSIFFGIVIGVVLAPIIAYADQSFRKNDAFTKTNYLLIASWILVPIFTLYFAYTLFYGYYETSKALAPLGMMIAAMIASASVMKNISETKINEELKHSRDIEKEELKHKRDTEKEDKKYAKDDSKFYLDKCTDGLNHVYALLKDGSYENKKWSESSKTLLTILKMSKNITENSHENVFQIEKRKYRLALLEIFDKKRITKNFFCGNENWETQKLRVSLANPEPVYVEDEMYFKWTFQKHILPNNIIPIIEFLFDLNTSKEDFEEYNDWENIQLQHILKHKNLGESNEDFFFRFTEMKWVVEVYDYLCLCEHYKDYRSPSINLRKPLQLTPKEL